MIISKLKSLKQNLEINLFPKAYKQKYFQNIEALSWKNIKNRNIENELLLIPYLLESGKGFIDVGANLGQYLCQAEKLTQVENIFAFEPHPALNKRLSKLFKGIHLSQNALSNAVGHTQFKIPYFNQREIHTRGTLKTEHIEVDETNSVLIDVEISTLDHFMIQNPGAQIALIKIDVEGAEFDVIDGAKKLIESQHPILIIEIEQRHHQTPILDFIKSLEQSGHYVCCYFDTQAQVMKNDLHSKRIEDLQAIDNHGKNRLFINNFIFIPQDSCEVKLAQINSDIQTALKA